MTQKQYQINTFTISIPADGGKYQLTLGDKTVSAKTLKYGVIKLFNKAGIIPGGTRGVEYQLADIIKGQAPSYQKELLLNILTDFSAEIPPLPPDPSQTIPDQQERASQLPIEESSSTAIVTINTPPVKVPYRRRGQTTIYDPIIDSAISRGGSCRVIADNLLAQGIRISHMSISRRIQEKNSGQPN